MTEFNHIPVLDLAPLIAGDDTAELAAAFARVYGEVGFAYVVNHGVDPGLRAEVFQASKRFHALALPAKQAVALNRQHRGYMMPSKTLANAINAGEYLLSQNQWLVHFVELAKTDITGATIIMLEVLPEVFNQHTVPTRRSRAIAVHGFQQFLRGWLTVIHFLPKHQIATGKQQAAF